MKDYSELRTAVSQEFRDLAKRFDLTPKHLAFCILSYFEEHPGKFCLVSTDPSRARKDTQPRKR